jgi:PAS domain S-box-containing protein
MVESCLKVLLVEDNPGDSRLIQEFLQEVARSPIQLTVVEHLAEALRSLALARVDVILLDLTLPDSQGLATCERIHQTAPSIPIIVLTGLNDETVAVRAVQCGAQDYLVKGQVTGDLLIRAIRYAIERQKSEQKIREQAALLDIATDAILERDLNHQILFWNKGAERTYGWTGAEAVGQNARTLLHQDNISQFNIAIQAVLQTGEWQGELPQRTKTGHNILVQGRWTLVRDEAGAPKSILTVDTDVTDKKRLEAQFLRAQRLENLGTLASGIAHDLNNILTPILAAAQLLPLKVVQADESTQRLLELLETSAKRGADLVKQILSFARGTEVKTTLIDIKQVLQDIERILHQTFPKSIQILTTIPEQGLWAVAADITQLHQVMLNLCVNARDAMPNGGVLTLSVKNQAIDAHLAQMMLSARPGPYVVITVTDTGIGMSPSVLNQMFDPFFTTKPVGQGTGLGLSTALRIIEHLGGFIHVDSEVGQGSQFKIYIPAEPAAMLPQAHALTLPYGNGESILVVDDEISVRETAKTSLEAYGYQVLTADDGADAIALCTHSIPNPHLLIMDMMMPGMDGITTIRALQTINPSLPIIATSGLPSQGIQTKTMINVRAFLPKPYTLTELLDTVHQVLTVSTDRYH